RDRKEARFGHSIGRTRPCILKDQDVLGLHVEVGIIDALSHVLKRSKDDRAALDFEQRWRRRRTLDDGAIWGQRAEQGYKTALRLERLVSGGYDPAVDVVAFLCRETLAQGLSRHGHAVQMEQGLEFAQDGTDPASREE